MSTKSTDLGDRCKQLEELSPANTLLLPRIPIVARLDGKAFHTFTKGLEKPFCKELHELMVLVTKQLVADSNATIGYTQSDEITLVWDATATNSQIVFNGKVAKLLTVLTSICTAHFNANLPKFLPKKKGPALFDCRIWNVPTRRDALDVLVWREADASKNSISMAAQAQFSHKQCQNKNGSELQEMLFQEKGINWSEYPACFKRGTYVRRKDVELAFSSAELEKLPAKHEARKNPKLKVLRSILEELNPPALPKITNLEDFVFSGSDPIMASPLKTRVSK